MPRKRPPLLDGPRLALGVTLLSAAGGALAVWSGRLDLLSASALHVTAVSLLTFVLFAWDKRRAANGVRRIAESNLLLASWLGGGPGGWTAMRRLRHKTRHWYFRLGVPLAALVQIGLLAWIALRQKL